ncbi:MAG: hypothetical protein ABL891_16600 [Burkholderiales bacterium]
MKIKFSRFFPIAALLLWQPHASAFAQEEIRFNKGATTGTVRGEVTTTIKTYQFRAQKGQRITAVLEPAGGDKGMLTMTLYAYCGEEYGRPLASEALRWEGELPCNDRYTIDVAPSTDAMKAVRVQRYALTLTIR